MRTVSTCHRTDRGSSPTSPRPSPSTAVCAPARSAVGSESTRPATPDLSDERIDHTLVIPTISSGSVPLDCSGVELRDWLRRVNDASFGECAVDAAEDGRPLA
jgi:hypothetical protein